MMGVLETVRSFTRTRWHSRAGLDPAQFKRWQQRALQHWLREALPKVAFYADAPADLRSLPVVDKADLMANFAAFNILGITAEQVHHAMERDFRIGALTVGASTGTSGQRGVFVISEAERFRWLGNILAKALPDMIWQRQRVAIILPQGGALYESARKASRISLALFDLDDGAESWRAELEAFDPTVIVAPPKVLRLLAEDGFTLTPTRVFSAAETLDPVDRTVIERYFPTPLEQIYMASEGLFGVTCRMGKLHLAEDAVHFEFDPVGDGLVSPLITSFQRTTQIMARYRMNDLLRLSPAPCACGSPLRAVDEVVGRMDDCFRFDTPEGGILVTPDVLRNTVLQASRTIDDFRLSQLSRRRIALDLPTHVAPQDAQQAKAHVEALLSARGARAEVALRHQPLSLEPDRKLRRVRCVSHA